MVVGNEKLKEYLERVCRDACVSEQRPVDVDFQYALVDNCLIVALRCPYQRVLRRINYRLDRNLPKNFGLEYCNIDEVNLKGIDFIFGDIDYNFSFAEWEVFGVWGTLRIGEDEKLNPHLHISANEGITSRLNALEAVGFKPVYHVVELKHCDWADFCKYYEVAYGERPYTISETVSCSVR